jgi:RNA polymerase sigma factor (sigma-70 family)
MSKIRPGLRQPQTPWDYLAMLDATTRIALRMTTEDPLIQAQSSEHARLLKLAVENLPDRERAIIECRFFDSMTLLETAKTVGRITKERVRQIEMRAIRYLAKDKGIQTIKKELYNGE